MRTYIFVLCAFFLCPAFAYAALININTANLTTLETLPHIGASLGQRIIDYRTQNGPFAAITDLQKVSGIGSGSNYADIAPLITISDSGVSNATPNTATSTTIVATTTPSSSTAASNWTPDPCAITIDVGPDRTALAEVPIHLAVHVRTTSGADDSSAAVVWSFGDGSSGSGANVDKTYRYPGTYAVQAIARDGSAVTRDDLAITVTPASVRIANLSPAGTTIANDTNQSLDLSGWRLFSGGNMFLFPEGTLILPQASAFFPDEITNLPAATDAMLVYPSGTVAARFEPDPPVATSTPIAQVQPRVVATSAHREQGKSPAISSVSEPAHESTAVNAPATSTEIAAAGAALLDSPKSGGANMLKSPWALGFVGLLVLSGGAFMIL